MSPVKRFEACVYASLVCTFGVTRLASAAVVNSPPASDFYEARSKSYKDSSDEAVILSYVRRYSAFEEDGGLECILRSQVWDGDANEKKADYIAAAGAVLYVLANYSYFNTRYSTEMDALLNRCGGTSPTISVSQKITNIRTYIQDCLGTDVRRVGRVGTDYGPDGIDADFDMALHGLAHLMYLFQDDPVSLPTQIIYRILCMGDECKDPPEHFHKWGGSGGFFLFDLNSSGEEPYNYFTVMHQEIRPNAETEIYQRNHFMKPYFVSDYDSYLPSDESWESTPELYFRTEDLMLAAGGQWERYYEDRIYKDYNVVARPTMLFGRGDFGHRLQPDLEDSIPGGWLWRQDHDHAMGDALQNVMLVPGKRSVLGRELHGPAWLQHRSGALLARARLGAARGREGVGGVPPYLHRGSGRECLVLGQ